MTDIKRLRKIDEEIQRIASEFGLDFFRQKFDLIPSDKMLEFMAYRFPNNFSHWSFGRDYEILRKKFEEGKPIPLEIVYNLDPSRAYIMKDLPIALQITTMAHVFGHNDFMKNNFRFGFTRRDMLSSASFARERFLKYESDLGRDEVEKTIDAGMALELNINPDLSQEPQIEEERRKFLIRELKRTRNTKSKKSKKKKLLSLEEFKEKTPLEPEQDILFYLIDKAPIGWQRKDILNHIWEQSRYLVPQRETKIMNEGWASLWHFKIMDRLLKDKVITPQEWDTFNYWNGRILAWSPWQLNPYLLGICIWRDIEDRWNKGKFGKDYEKCKDSYKKKYWNKKLGLGNEKLFEVRDTYTDINFIEELLTKEIIDDLKLYIYVPMKTEDGKIVPVVVSRNPKIIKWIITRGLINFGVPYILIEDGNYQERNELYLKQVWEGVGLDKEYREETTKHTFDSWQNPVHIETVERVAEKKGFYAQQEIKLKKVLYTFNGDRHEGKVLRDVDPKELEKLVKIEEAGLNFSLNLGWLKNPLMY